MKIISEKVETNETFISRMVISGIFRQLPEQFTYAEFELVFMDAFAATDVSYNDAESFIDKCLDYGLIDFLEEGFEIKKTKTPDGEEVELKELNGLLDKFSFNGVAYTAQKKH